MYILGLHAVVARRASVAPDVAVRRERRNDRGRGEVDLAAQRDDDDPHVHRVEGRGLKRGGREAIQVGDHQDVVVVDVAQTTARERHTGRFAASQRKEQWSVETVVRIVSHTETESQRESQ